LPPRFRRRSILSQVRMARAALRLGACGDLGRRAGEWRGSKGREHHGRAQEEYASERSGQGPRGCPPPHGQSPHLRSMRGHRRVPSQQLAFGGQCIRGCWRCSLPTASGQGEVSARIVGTVIGTGQHGTGQYQAVLRRHFLLMFLQKPARRGMAHVSMLCV
jgi:hypothetical protein